jgi:hypothetical protein
MYGGSLLFLIYVYGAFLIHPLWKLPIQRLPVVFRTHSMIDADCSGSAPIAHRNVDSIDSSDCTGKNRVSHSGEPAGGLYLRLGCIGMFTFFD